MQRYAPDTNFFLQFKLPEELPWAELTNADDIELIVLAEVLGELDKHKNGGNERRAARSRSTLQRLRPLIVTDQETIELRKQGPRVVYRLAPDLPVERAKPATLDISTADGRIVEEALACKAVMGDLALLTHDSLPMLTARRHGLPIAPLPETWRLPPERDAKDKEIAGLKAELAAWTARAPDIAVQMGGADESVECIEGNLTRYAPLSRQFLGQAMQAVLACHPDASAGIAGQLSVTRQSDRQKYENERKQWIASVKDKLEHYHLALNDQNSLFPLTLSLQNIGSASAEALVVEVFAEGNVSLTSPEAVVKFWEKHPVKLDLPPFLPTAFDLFNPLGNRMAISDALLRDLYAPNVRHTPVREFRWQFDEPDISSKRLEGSCMDFRHQIHQESVVLALFVPAKVSGEPVGCIRVRYSAKNLTHPVEKVWPVRFTYAWRDTEAETAQFLQDQLDVTLT